MQQAEACGKVVYVNTKNKSIFHIFAENANKKFACRYEGFLPIKNGDSILGICEYTRTGKEELLTFKAPPYVVIGSDKQTILENLSTALRGTGYSQKKGELIYEVLLREA